MDKEDPSGQQQGQQQQSSASSLQEDLLSLAARTLNPEHLRNASNEELIRIMQSLKKTSGLAALQDKAQAAGIMTEDHRLTADDITISVNGTAAAAAESDSPMAGITYSPGKGAITPNNNNDMRRQSVSLPLFSDKPGSSQLFAVDRRGSLGSLPRMLGMAGGDRIGLDGGDVMKDAENDVPGLSEQGRLRIPLARPVSPNPSGPTQPAGSPQSLDQKLRLEVETTLHKTLELEYMLTVKEYKSYEAHSEAAELEYTRAAQAYREAEAVLRDRRRELDTAIQERSEVQSILRYLSTRLEGLGSRIRDGSNRLANMRAGKGSEGRPAGAMMGVVGTGLAPPSSLISARRHSSPGLVSLASQGLPMPLLSSIDRDLDEWTRGDSMKTDVEAGLKSASSSGSNQKRARTTSPADNEPEAMMGIAPTSSAGRSGLSVNTAMGYANGPQGPSSASEAPSHKSMSASDPDHAALAMVRLGAGSALGDREAVPGSSAAVVLSDRNLQLAAREARERAENSGQHVHGPNATACVAYQRIQCPLSQKDCPSLHVCIRCQGPHPVIMCKKDRNVCVKWNMEDCTSACHREHRCLRCASKEHTLRNLDNYLIEYIKRRRGEGVPEEDLSKLEAQVSAATLSSTGPGSAAAAMSISLSSLAPSNSGGGGGYGASTGSLGRNGGSQTPVMQATSGMVPYNVHGPNSSPNMMSTAYGRGNAMGVAGMGMGMTPMGMAGMGMGGLGGPAVGYPGAFQQQAYGFPGGPGAVVGGLVGMTPGVPGMGNGLLTEMERKSICRDYNNFKCEVEDSSVTFA
ncbi:hypothetical protein HDU96_001503 [Phlyctochytrium bullatum]|nr:hypothetical protein HDU96_001503 [Phlyctochytrium bullatum]